MLNRNKHYEWLLPYLEGELDDGRKAQMEARLAADPMLAAEAARLRQTLDGLRQSAAHLPAAKNSAFPSDFGMRLRARLDAEAKPDASREQAPAPRPRAQGWWLAGVGASATAALIVAAFWLPGWRAPDLATTTDNPARRSVRAPQPGGTRIPPTPTPLQPHPATIPPPTARPVQTPKAQKPEAALFSGGPKGRPIQPAPITDPFALPTNSSVPSVPTVAKRSATPPAVMAPAPTMGNNNQPTAPVAVFSAPRPAPGPPPPPSENGSQALNRLAPTQDAPHTAAAFGGGFAGAAAPKATGDAEGQVKPQRKALSQSPAPAAGAAGPVPPGARRDRRGKQPAQDRALLATPQLFDAAAGLDSAQAALSTAVQPPLWGDTAGEQQAGQALLAVKEAGLLDDLRARLEARRTQSPRDVTTGRMLAAVYDYGFSSDAALRERRRTAALEGATGEDWFALAQAEERAGNGQAARAAYRRALESPVPPSAYHAAIARQKG